MITEIPIVKFYPWKIVFYRELDGYYRKPSDILEVRKRAYSGLITKSAQSKIRDKILLLNYLSPRRKVFNTPLQKMVYFKLSFLTLTLSAEQNIPDKIITKDLLAPFIRHYRYLKLMNNYVWKAEKQKNGNIHYHIISDMFVTYSDLLNYWNKLQSKTDMIDKFQAKYGHRSPNSVDIRQVKSSKELGRYLAKYVSKSGSRIAGKTWDCADGLNNFDFKTCIIDTKTSDFVDRVVSRYGGKVLQYDYCKVIYMDEKYYQLIN